MPVCEGKWPGAVTTEKERIGWVAATGVGERKTRRALGDQHATRPVGSGQARSGRKDQGGLASRL